jgi:hypothetical protein
MAGDDQDGRSAVSGALTHLHLVVCGHRPAGPVVVRFAPRSLKSERGYGHLSKSYTAHGALNDRRPNGRADHRIENGI